MKFTGWVMSAGLVVAATAANAQALPPYAVAGSPYATASDFEGPYAAVPPEAPAPRYGGPMLLPPQEVYTIVRESGFSPLGIPHQRGFVYTIAVIDRRGDDGRLVIDARNGRIIRLMPAYRRGNNFNDDATVVDGPVGPPPPIAAVRGPPRPPASVPHVASRMPPSVPVPKPSPRAGGAKPLAAKPAPPPAQQSAAAQPKPADTQGAPPTAAPAQAAAPAIVEAKPAAPQILPTQEMPKVQGLE